MILPWASSVTWTGGEGISWVAKGSERHRDRRRSEEVGLSPKCSLSKLRCEQTSRWKVELSETSFLVFLFFFNMILLDVAAHMVQIM